MPEKIKIKPVSDSNESTNVVSASGNVRDIVTELKQHLGLLEFPDSFFSVERTINAFNKDVKIRVRVIAGEVKRAIEESESKKKEYQELLGKIDEFGYLT